MAVAFDRVNYIDSDPTWELRWVYAHPYARGQGLVDPHWPVFEERYGRFGVQSPVSRAGKAMLDRLGWKPPYRDVPADAGGARAG